MGGSFFKSSTFGAISQLSFLFSLKLTALNHSVIADLLTSLLT